MGMSILAWILALLITTSCFGGQSFQALAGSTMETQLREVSSQVEAILHPRVLPHEVKALRKQVGLVKLLLDVFIHVYPQRIGREQRDIWQESRDLFDRGYEVLGQFKDEFDRLGIPVEQVQADTYDSLRLRPLRGAVLVWKKSLLAHLEKQDVRTYLEQPPEGWIEPRPRKQLPKYIWRLLASKPEPYLDGVQNLARTTAGILQEVLRSGYFEVLAIEDIFAEGAEQKLHDLRKMVRMVGKLVRLFSHLQLIPEGELKGEAMTLLDELVDRCGAINDGFMRTSEDREHSIVEAFAELKQWQEDKQVRKALFTVHGFLMERVRV